MIVSLPLQPHPTDARPSAFNLRFDCAAGAGGLCLTYTLRGPLQTLRLPLAAIPGPADGLWRHTCCELFVAAADSPAYREFNFSPSGQWAAYAFSACRTRDADPQGPPPTLHPAKPGADSLRFDIHLPLSALPAWGRLDLGPAMVLEHADGQCSFWAARHCAERPDFHQRDSLVLSIYLESDDENRS